jgi:hypothetical protein
MGRAHCGGERHPRSRLGQANASSDADVTVRHTLEDFIMASYKHEAND